MLRRFVIALAILLGLGALADRAVANAAGNATGRQIRIHEGLKEDAEVHFRGFPFLAQAVRGTFDKVDVTARDVVRGGLTIERIDAHLEGVKVDLRKAMKGQVHAVPVRDGAAEIEVTYADLQAYLANRPGNIRFAVNNHQVTVISTYGVPGAGQVEVEGTPTLKVSGTTLTVTVTNVRTTAGTPALSATLASQAGLRSSFTVSFKDLPFGIQITTAKLTDTGLVVAATAEGIVVDLRR